MFLWDLAERIWHWPVFRGQMRHNFGWGAGGRR